MRLLPLALVAASIVAAQTTERPLTALPYSPSLDSAAMDRSVDPCQDFYAYACGGWLRANPIPADQVRWDVYGKLAQDNQRYLWGILEQAAAAPANPIEKQIGDYFVACMDEGAAEKAGLTPLAGRLDSISRLKSKKQLAALIAKLGLETRGRGFPFGFGADQDLGDSTRVIAFATAGGLSLPDRDYYTKTDPKSVETRAKYEAHIAKMLELAGAKPAAAKAGARTVLEIETELAKASLTRVDQRDPYKLFHKMKRAELAALTPAFDWNAFLKASGIADIADVNVTEPDFFRRLNTLIRQRSLDQWKTYLRWHALDEAAPYLASSFAQEHFNFFRKYLFGTPADRPRWKKCVAWVDRDLGESLGRIFVDRTFSPATKERALTMTKQIEAAMEQDLNDLTWMGPETKKRAHQKLQAIANKIGYPDRWRDYSSVQVSRANLVGNVENATVFESRRQLAKIGKPVDRGEWGMTPPTVNAYYNPQMNDINFPAGVLQPPLFDPKMDDAPNYGNTGATIGHELTHAFDDEGRQFDAEGNLKDWWTKQDGDAFNERAACVVKQYGDYIVVDDIKLNSKLTLGEDVADLGGTLLAYMAWKNATRGQRLEPVEGLTPDQRFFVGMAQWACGDERPETKRVNAVTNPHSPLKYRVNGVVSNLPQFAEAFSCKPAAPMVRAQACRVW